MLRLLVVFCFVISTLQAEILFSGYFTMGPQIRLRLTETATSTSSGWLKLDESYHGVTLASFDAERETLVVQQNGHSRGLPLSKGQGRPINNHPLECIRRRFEIKIPLVPASSNSTAPPPKIPAPPPP